MRYTVIFAPAAEADLEDAFRWIARDSLGNAVKWYNCCINAIKSLRDFPGRCALAPENDVFKEDIRQLIYGNYRILYTIRGGFACGGFPMGHCLPRTSGRMKSNGNSATASCTSLKTRPKLRLRPGDSDVFWAKSPSNRFCDS